jgi:ABC-type sugar transport system ATPase subunit
MATNIPLIGLFGLSKRYEHVQALRDVDVEFHAGRCHTLVGENGAGKSTLIKIIGGLVRPDSGRFEMNGRPLDLHSPADALANRIAVVPQELTFVPHLSVAENICLGDMDLNGPFVAKRRMSARARELLHGLGVEIDVSKPLGSFGPAIQQLAMIARGLARDAQLLVLDEPTASLSNQETSHLFTVLDRLKSAGKALVYVSHRMSELRRIADDVTVLRDGVRVASWAGEGFPEEELLIETMVGRPIQRFFSTDRKKAAGTEEVLRVEGLTRGNVLRDISFTVAAGEILAVTGLMGAGRTEIMRCLVGYDMPDRMRMLVDGREVRPRNPGEAKRAGIVLVPEERKAQGLVEMMSVADNISLPHLKLFSRGGFLADVFRRARVAGIAETVGLRAAVYDTPVRQLSGGNQQKVVIGKSILGTPRVILLDEPTRGIDVAVKHSIYSLVGAAADAGCAVVMASSDMQEVLGIADRILVMRAGSVAGELDSAQASERAILRLAMPSISPQEQQSGMAANMKEMGS